ncbi:MAG: hypothetical protein HHAS10_05370 [Candidatus Altimarinota bacterium]
MQRLLQVPGIILRAIPGNRLGMLTLRNTINKALEGMTQRDLLTIKNEITLRLGGESEYWKYTLGSGKDLDESIYDSLFKEIIAPTLGISQLSPVYYGQRKEIVRNFISCLEDRLRNLNEETPELGSVLIDRETILRISRLEGFGVVVAHLEESNKLAQNGFNHVAYSEMMKAIEKILKKMCLIYHRDAYTKEYGETPINAKMEDILKFLRKLRWNDRQYIKPIDDLNKFANDDKHAITQRGNIGTIEQYDYNGVICFILDWIDGLNKSIQ